MNYKITLLLLLVASFACNQKKTLPETLFTKVESSESGLDFSNDLNENDSMNYFTYPYIYMGGGVAVGDVNGDGLEDLYFTANMKSNSLFLNRGDLKFEEVTEAAGVGGDDRWMTGVTFVDINADNKLDIYVSVSGLRPPFENLLFVNQGNDENGVPKFEEQGEAYGIADQGHTTQATFFDADNDGDLDLFTANYPITKFNVPAQYYAMKIENPELEHSSHFYKNDGGKFIESTEAAGMLSYGLSLSATAGDYNNDGFIDLYVSNDFACPDFFYFNNGDGTFTERVKEVTNQIPFYGMGADAADYNNDGLLDIMQVDMAPESHRRSKENMAGMNPEGFYTMVNYGLHHQYMFNALQLSRGIDEQGLPMYSDAAWIGHVSKTDWSWAPLFADFDNDGLKDLFVSNGTRRDINNRDFFFKSLGYFSNDEGVKTLADLEEMPSEAIPNYAFKNNGDLTFDKVAKDWGLAEPSFSNGAVYADLDQDGDLEIVVNNIDTKAFLYKNWSVEKAGGKFLQVKLKGAVGNPLALGTKVKIETASGMQMIETTMTRGFQSSVSPLVHFGLGADEVVERVTVTWHDGKISVMQNVSVNQALTVTYADAKPAQEEAKEDNTQFFAETSADASLVFEHRENGYNDFSIEPLLPHKTSNFGPGLASGDVNGDGLADVYFGGAAGQSGQLFIQGKDGSFVPSKQQVWEADVNAEDLDAIFFDAEGDGDLDLYVVSGGNEFKFDDVLLRDRLYINNGKGNFAKSQTALPAISVSGGKVLPFDYDKDGDLDLFIGVRLTPSQYPVPANSYLLQNNSTKQKVSFADVTAEIIPALTNLGMVTDAVATDFDGDKDLDLILVGEWMPITFLANADGKFSNVTEKMGFDESTGWWFSIEQADIDQDGDMDYIVGNLGLNYKYRASAESTFDIYSTDFDKNGRRDIVLGFYQNGTQFPVRGRQCSSEQIPDIKNKFKNYKEFAGATLQDIYTPDMLETALHYKVKSFASVYLENKGAEGFVTHQLPNEAQLSPINDMVIEDFNADGKLDVLIAGNLFAAEVETPRGDASRGLLMLGDGAGGFKPLAYAESGINLPYDAKKLGLIEVAGKKSVVVANNNEKSQMLMLQE